MKWVAQQERVEAAFGKLPFNPLRNRSRSGTDTLVNGQIRGLLGVVGDALRDRQGV